MPLTRENTKLLKGLKARKPHFYRKRKFAEQFQERGYDAVAQKLRNCQETELLACCGNCGHHWWVINRCRLRVCPLCAYEQSKRRAAFMHLITQEMAYPKMLTLTMPLWTDTPQVGIMYLRKCFGRLRRSKVFRSVIGGCYQIEVKLKEEGFHIHLHAIIDSPYMPRQHIFSRWKEILGCEAPQVHITACTEAKQREYVCKYAAKAADFDQNAGSIVDWYEATKGTRLFSTFGKWFNVKISQLDPLQTDKPPKPPCPACGDVGATFLARDGPFIYGGKAWGSVAMAFCGDEPIERNIELVTDVLNGKQKLKDLIPEEYEKKEEDSQCQLQTEQELF